VCPECDREFARERQSHVCVPGCTVDQAFASRPAYQRDIYDRLMAHLEGLGPIHKDAVSVGVFLKGDRKFAEIRPMARSLSVALLLPRAVRDGRFTRVLRGSGGQAWHFLRLGSVAEVDEQVLDWLTEAYMNSEE
jgi:hypothetical protein